MTKRFFLKRIYHSIFKMEVLGIKSMFSVVIYNTKNKSPCFFLHLFWDDYNFFLLPTAYILE